MQDGGGRSHPSSSKDKNGCRKRLLTLLLLAGARDELVEDVEAPLLLRLPDHASLLQQVGL